MFAAMSLIKIPLFTKWILIGEKDQRNELDIEPEMEHIDWNPDRILLFSTSSSLAGIMAGMFGIGGSLLNQQLLLNVAKVSPEISAASCSTMILFTAAAACSVYVSFRVLQMGLGALMICIGLFFTWIGQNGIGWVVRKLNRPSLIVLTMNIVITTGLIPLFIRSMVVLAHLIKHPDNMWKFHKLCPE